MYKEKHQSIMWDVCGHVMKDNFSNFTMDISSDDINMKAKQDFHRIYIEHTNRIFDESYKLSLKKEEALSKFKEMLNIEEIKEEI